ncbi:MAG: pyridoxal phosphate-dependent aminotransferase family protein, partial [Bacteroidales bacterium]|nr:pyridoxal phosphate-dependent aminotransferase family protein [Bacteroidales bacterium]
PEHIMNFLRYHMRTQIHSKALPIIYAAGVLKRLDYLAENPKLKVELHKKVLYFRKALREKGFDTGNSNAVAIPIFLSCTIYQALNLIIDLRENYNVFCPVLVYPFVMKDKLMLRFLPTILHSLEDIDYTVTAMCAVRQNLEDGKYNDKSDYMSDEEAI